MKMRHYNLDNDNCIAIYRRSYTFMNVVRPFAKIFKKIESLSNQAIISNKKHGQL